MTTAFDDRINEAWSESQWILDDMFDSGMCFFEGYIPVVDLTGLESRLSQLTDKPSSIDFSHSVWSESTSETDWNRTYPLKDYVRFFQTGRISMLHADYIAVCAGYSFTFKLIFEREANLEVICYRDNLLPRNETQDRFKAACHHLKDLHILFDGKALFLGPDTLNYPVWPNLVPDEWQRLL